MCRSLILWAMVVGSAAGGECAAQLDRAQSDSAGQISSQWPLDARLPVPISVESPACGPEPSNRAGFPMTVYAHELSRIAVAAALRTDPYSMEWNHGMVLMRPARCASIADGHVLDMKISLQLEGVSIMDALLALFQTVNEDLRTERVLMLHDVMCSDRQEDHPCLHLSRVVTVHLDHAPIRDILCEILRQSPVPLRYEYWEEGPEHYDFPKDHTYELGRMSLSTAGDCRDDECSRLRVTTHWSGFSDWAHRINSLTPEKIQRRQLIPTEVKQLLDQSAHAIPVSLEWSYLDAYGGALRKEVGPVGFDTITIENAGHLMYALKKKSGGMLRLLVINDQIVLTSTPVATESLPRAYSLLDEPLSLQLHHATTWEAIKALVQAVNALPHTNRVISLSLGICNDASFAPACIANERCVSMNAVNRSAREVLSEIMQQSPINLRYTYRNQRAVADRCHGYLSASLAVSFYYQGNDLFEKFVPLPSGQAANRSNEWWGRELTEVNELPPEKL